MGTTQGLPGRIETVARLSSTPAECRVPYRVQQGSAASEIGEMLYAGLQVSRLERAKCFKGAVRLERTGTGN
jgi:hypothetical protein